MCICISNVCQTSTWVLYISSCIIIDNFIKLKLPPHYGRLGSLSMSLLDIFCCWNYAITISARRSLVLVVKLYSRLFYKSADKNNKTKLFSIFQVHDLVQGYSMSQFCRAKPISVSPIIYTDSLVLIYEISNCIPHFLRI